MRRSALDKLISSMGLALAVLLFVGGGLLVFGSTFVSQQVSDQLTSQRITMPSGAALDKLGNAEDKAALEPYAGETMSTGAQAKAFADHYILNHMNASSDGRTYEEVSGEFQKLSDAEKASPDGQEMAALRQSLFMGNSIRGMLLNAYAFGTMATIMAWAAVAAFVGGIVMLVLAVLGFRNAKSAGDPGPWARPLLSVWQEVRVRRRSPLPCLGTGFSNQRNRATCIRSTESIL